MNVKSMLVTSVAVVALGFSSVANAEETTAANQSDANIAASTAGTEIEKAVGAGDTFSEAELASQVKLSAVENPAVTLASAKVDDMDGNIIGPVKSVAMDNDKVDAIHVNVGGWLGMGDTVVAIKASHFTYIPSRNILLTALSKEEVKKLAEVKEDKKDMEDKAVTPAN